MSIKSEQAAKQIRKRKTVLVETTNAGDECYTPNK